MCSMLRSALYGGLRSSSVVLSAVSALVAGIYAVQRRRRTARLRPRRPDAASHVQITVHNNLHRRHWPRTTSISPSERLVARARLLNEFGAKTRELLIGDGT